MLEKVFFFVSPCCVHNCCALGWMLVIVLLSRRYLASEGKNDKNLHHKQIGRKLDDGNFSRFVFLLSAFVSFVVSC